MTVNKDDTVTPIDKPRCSRCLKFKPVEELNGYNPFAPVGQKSKNAYCIKLVDCESPEAKAILDDLLDHLDRDK
jgi:hypothetical protein